MRKYYLLMIICLLLTSCKTKTYTVTFIDDNKELASINIKKGDNISNIDKPTKEGYLFLNWQKEGLEYDDNSPINSDITLEAVWVEVPNPVKTYTVSFNFGGEVKKMSVKENDKVTEPKEIPHKDKFKFLGWYDGNELYDFNKPVTKDFVLIAKFERNRITINYDLNGGTGTVQVEIEKGKIPDKPKDPAKFGYTFKNWTIDGKLYLFDTPLDEDTTIKANYEANIYVEVTFDTDGGNIIPKKYIVSGNAIDNLPAPIKEGYNFIYWTYNGEKFDPNMNIITNIVLKAVYEKND